MSVVVRPAWASTGGIKLNRKTATTPAAREKSSEPHQYTAMQAIQKNGNIPSRAIASVRS